MGLFDRDPIYEISKSNWDKVHDIIDCKNQLISEKEDKIEELEEQLAALSVNAIVQKKDLEISSLKIKNNILVDESKKLKRQISTSEASFTLLTNQLTESFNLLECHGLLAKKSKITDKDVRLLDMTA